MAVCQLSTQKDFNKGLEGWMANKTFHTNYPKLMLSGRIMPFSLDLAGIFFYKQKKKSFQLWNKRKLRDSCFKKNTQQNRQHDKLSTLPSDNIKVTASSPHKKKKKKKTELILAQSCFYTMWLKGVRGFWKIYQNPFTCSSLAFKPATVEV